MVDRRCRRGRRDSHHPDARAREARPWQRRRPAPQGTLRLVPDELRDTSWLAERSRRRRSRRLPASRRSTIFSSPIARRRAASPSSIASSTDAAITYKAAHYDHGTGIAVADVDGDGLTDIYFVNQIGGNQLWKNAGGGKFQDITATAGVAVPGKVGVSASFADIDNDGDADLYATTVRGGNMLFENDGRGRFRDISAASGLGYVGHSSAAVFFDYDRDGRLDLFLVNVGRYTTDTLVDAGNKYYGAFEDAFTGHLKPERAERSILFHNEGGNRFVDVSKRMGLVDVSWSGDASVVDVNDDGWLDLYVLNMQGNDEYYENAGGKRFVRQEPPGVSPDLLGLDGHQGVRRQQRRPARHLHHRHALGHERDGRPRARQDEVDDEVARVLSRRRESQHLGQLVLSQGGPREVSRGVRCARRRELLSVGAKCRRPQCRWLRRHLHHRRHELPRALHDQLAQAERSRPAFRRCRVRARRRAAAGRPRHAVVRARRLGQGQGASRRGRADGIGRRGRRARLALVGHLRSRRRRRSRHRHQRVWDAADGARQQPEREDDGALPGGEADRDDVESRRAGRDRQGDGRRVDLHQGHGRQLRVPVAQPVSVVFRARRGSDHRSAWKSCGPRGRSRRCRRRSR